MAVALLGAAVDMLPCKAAEVRVAVAANFTEPARKIATLYEANSGHQVKLSFGATGQFYAQITHGAPFDVLLSADQATPQKAVSEGLAVAGSAFTYATGRLVLFSRDATRVTGDETLREGRFAKIAIANPSLAPYGAAAIATLKALGVLDAVRSKIVQGASIAQAYQFVETGNAELGFVALSQVIGSSSGSRWIVPATLHAPIAQDAVLLKVGEDNAAAREFLEFLRQEPARGVIRDFGYGDGR
jgi:molybdate transport system substrate-binding protein